MPSNGYIVSKRDIAPYAKITNLSVVLLEIDSPRCDKKDATWLCLAKDVN